jgi:hypothetical protein
MKKSCSCCSQPVEYSLALVLSTVGISPRIQRCSPVVLFCKSCIHALATEECWWGSTTLCNALQRAYTATQQDSSDRLNACPANSVARTEEEDKPHLVESPMLDLLSP